MPTHQRLRWSFDLGSCRVAPQGEKLAKKEAARESPLVLKSTPYFYYHGQSQEESREAVDISDGPLLTFSYGRCASPAWLSTGRSNNNNAVRGVLMPDCESLVLISRDAKARPCR